MKKTRKACFSLFLEWDIFLGFSKWDFEDHPQGYSDKEHFNKFIDILNNDIVINQKDN